MAYGRPPRPGCGCGPYRTLLTAVDPDAQQLAVGILPGIEQLTEDAVTGAWHR